MTYCSHYHLCASLVKQDVLGWAHVMFTDDVLPRVCHLSPVLQDITFTDSEGEGFTVFYDENMKFVNVFFSLKYSGASFSKCTGHLKLAHLWVTE